MTNRILSTRLGTICLLAVCAVTMGHAQSMTQGAIAGTVFDATDAAVAKAIVQINNTATAATVTLTTGDAGEYRASQLSPGTYTVTVKAPGFKESRTNEVTVEVNGVTEINPHLVTGSETTSVEVTADAPVLKFDSAEFGGHLDNNEIENIPINNRRWSALALTTPAVTNDASGFGLLSFRAIPSVLNNVQIDGVDDNQAFFSEERGRTRAGYSTSQVAVREFQVNTGVYSAELGHAVGGVVNSVTKQGGNKLHGELYFYHRGDEFSSINEKTTITTPVTAGGVTTYVTNPFRPKDKRNQYGFGAGGPLIKDKLFWFYAFDAFRRNFPGAAVSGNPSSLYNNSACTAGLLAATGATATQCTAAITDLTTDLGTVPRYGNQLINTPKLTWQINSKHQLNVLFHRLRWDSPGGVQTQAALSYAVDAFGTDFVKLDYGVAKLNSVFGSKFTNELRYQYARELNDEGQQPFSNYTKNHLFGNGPVGINATYASVNTSSGGFNIGSPYYSYRVSYPDERKWEIGDTAAYLWGKHTIRFGFDIDHNYDLQNNVFQSNGSYSYASVTNYLADILRPGGACGARTTSGTPTLVATSTTTGYSCYSNEAQGFGPTTFDLATLSTGYFVQDDWKPLPNLTLNLGVRYDYTQLPAPYANAVSTLAPQEANHPSDKNNISPRIGFSWDPFSLGKSVLRGGFGLYYGGAPNAVLLNAYINTGTANGQASLTTYNGTNIGTTATPSYLRFPNILTARPASSALLSVQYLDAHLQAPYTEQFDLAIQQDLGFRNVLSVTYLGALGRSLPNYVNTNLDPNSYYNGTFTLAGNSAGQCIGAPCGTSFQQRVYTNNVLNSNYFAITNIVGNATSNYHALSVDVTNRQWKFLSYDANYTWAHALDYNVASFTSSGTNNYIDPYSNPRSNYGNSSLNIRHRAVGWAIVNLPGLKGNGALTYLTNGWSVKPLVQIQSGLPYSIAISSGSPTSLTTGGTTLAAFSSGIAGTGVSSYIPYFGRNTLYVPRNIVVDARVQKDFRLPYEGASLQLLAEAFNLANHRNITGVNTGAYTLGGTAGTGVTTLTTAAPNFFGIPSSSGVNGNTAYQVRQLQLGIRILF